MDAAYQEPPLSDMVMIVGIREDDPQILTMIKGYFKPKIQGMIWKKGADSHLIPQRSEDVYNETLVRVRQKLLSKVYQHCGKFCGYFMTIAKYVDAELFRKMVKEQETNRKIEDQSNLDVPESNDLDTLEAPTEAEDDRSELVALCIQALPSADRDLMNLHYRYGYKLKELARMYGISADAMKMRFCRIRKRVRHDFEAKVDQW